MPDQANTPKLDASTGLLFKQVQNHGWFHFLAQQTRVLQELQRLFSQAAGAELAQQCQVTGIIGDALVLQATNAMWATRLRFNAPQLLQALRAYPEFAALKQLQCHINPTTPPPQRRPAAPQALSSASSKALAEAAAQISDPQLKQALLRLARTP